MDLIELLFEHVDGPVKIATACQGRDWIERVWTWPDEEQAMRRWVEELEEDVFICPAPRIASAKGRAKNQGTQLRWLWADIDWHKVPEDQVSTVWDRAQKLATLQVESGTAVSRERWDGERSPDEVWPDDPRCRHRLPNLHIYVKLGREVTLEEHFKLNRKLKDLLHADAKHADNSLLRPDGTLNTKDYNRVTLPSAHQRPTRTLGPDGITRWLAEAGDDAPSVSGGGDRTWSPAPTDHIPGRVWAAVEMGPDEAIDRYGARYKAVWAVTRDLISAGYDSDTIHTLMDKCVFAEAKRQEEHGAYDVHKDVWRCLDQAETAGRVVGGGAAPTEDIERWEEELRAGEAPAGVGKELVGVGDGGLDLGGVFSALKRDCGSLSPSMVELSALVVMASLMPNVSFKTAKGAGALVRPNLFGALVASTGVGKTPVMNMVTKRLNALNAEAAKAARDNEIEWKIKSRKKDATAADMKRPRNDRHLVGSTTFEALTMRLEDNRYSSALICADELATVTSGWGQYKSGGRRAGAGDEAAVLSLWSGQDLDVARVGETSRYVAGPYLSMLGGVQPSHIGELGDLERGAISRYLFAYGSHRTGREVEWRRCDAYETVVDRLWNARGVVREYLPTLDALRLLEEMIEAWSSVFVAADSSAAKIAMTSKAPELCKRVAVALADIRAAEADELHGRPGDDGRRVERVDVEQAVALVNRSVNSYLSRAGRRGVEDVIRSERKVDLAVLDALSVYLERIESTGKKWVTARDLVRARVAGIRSAEDARRELLVAARELPGQVWEATCGRDSKILLFTSRPSRDDIHAAASSLHSQREYDLLPYGTI